MALRLDRFALFYPLRIVGAYFIVLFLALHAYQVGRFTLLPIILIGVLLIWSIASGWSDLPYLLFHSKPLFPQQESLINTRLFG